MNITPVNNFIGINDNKNCSNKNNPAFRHAVFEGELKDIFTTTKLARPFVNVIERIKTIPINLIEILQYNKATGARKMLLDEFFEFIGINEVNDYTVILKPKPIYDEKGQLIAYDLTFNGTIPVEPEKYKLGAGEENFYKDHEIPPFYFSSEYEFDTGKTYVANDRHHYRKPVYLRVFNGSIKEKLCFELSKCFANICQSENIHQSENVHKSPVSKQADIKPSTEDNLFQSLQTLITSDRPLFETEEGTGLRDIHLFESAFDLLQTTRKHRNATELIICNLFRDAGINPERCQTRIKGEDDLGSLISKMLKCAKTYPFLNELIRFRKPEWALERIYDIFGVRFAANSEQELNNFYNTFVNYVKAGVIVPTEVINYHAIGTEPFFSDKQINDLKQLTEQRHLATSFHDKTLETGYTSVNIHTEVINGRMKQPVEIQISNQATTSLVKILHDAYNMFVNKKSLISKYDGEKQKIYKPLEDALITIKDNELLREKFNQYTHKCYSIARYGSTDFPNATEYGLPEIVSIHEMAKIYEQLNDVTHE